MKKQIHSTMELNKQKKRRQNKNKLQRWTKWFQSCTKTNKKSILKIKHSSLSKCCKYDAVCTPTACTIPLKKVSTIFNFKSLATRTVMTISVKNTDKCVTQFGLKRTAKVNSANTMNTISLTLHMYNFLNWNDHTVHNWITKSVWFKTKRNTFI